MEKDYGWLATSRNRSVPADWPVALVSLFCYESIGVRAMASFLRAAGCNTDTIFLKQYALNHFPMPTESEICLLLDLLKAGRYQAVAISVRSPYGRLASALTRQIQEHCAVPVIWGGTAPTVAPEDALRRGADYAIQGEGEEALVDLISALAAGNPAEEIANVWRMRDGQVSGMPVRPLIRDLDGLPIPDLGDENKYWIDGKVFEGDPSRKDGRYDIMTSRGCPFRCTYCSNSTFHRIYEEETGPFHRQRSVGHVMSELENAKQMQPNLSTIVFQDEVFTQNEDWLGEFVPRYKEALGMPFECLTHPRFLSEPKALLLKEAGAVEINIGIQAGSDRVRHEIFKRFSIEEDIIAAARIVRDMGIVGRYDIISDNPYAGEEDKRQTLELLLKLPHPWILNMYSLHFFPNTDLTNEALAHGMVTEEYVEADTERCLCQHTCSFSHKRDPADQCWNALFALTSKAFIPDHFTRWLSRRAWLFRHPGPVVLLSRAASLVRLAVDGTSLLIQGRIDLRYAIRFLASIHQISR